MNFTAVSIGFALIQPFLKTIIKSWHRREREKEYEQTRFTLVHGLKGRRRYRSALLKDPAFAANIGAAVAKLSEDRRFMKSGRITRVAASALTGTVLFEYTCDDSRIDLIVGAINRSAEKAAGIRRKEPARPAAGRTGAPALGYDRSGGAAAAPGSGRRRADSTLRTALNYMTDQVSRSFSYNFANILDISTVIGLGFMAWGAYKITTLKQTPNGPQLLWWGYQMLDGRKG